MKVDPSGLRESGALPPTCKPDPLGSIPNCCCGPRIDVPLALILEKIGSDFKAWSYIVKQQHCLSLYTNAEFAWDIQPLVEYSSPIPGCGTDISCKYSVEVRGTCHCAGFVNYLAFGRMMGMCWAWAGGQLGTNASDIYSQQTMDLLISVWKRRMYHDPLGAKAGMAWADIGWNDALAYATLPPPSKSGCRTSESPNCRPCRQEDNQPWSYSWNMGTNY